jgi:hypothetical protein
VKTKRSKSSGSGLSSVVLGELTPVRSWDNVVMLYDDLSSSLDGMIHSEVIPMF